ncbi:MAG TPA: tetratricopeptide repeat protein [Polyangia bacterium]|nr:tetratricopeptide repeat protein [Polyangia bacterium]
MNVRRLAVWHPKVVAVVTCLALALLSVRARAATDPREIKAREDFVAGRYQEALDLFAKLYAETLHPNYLRNIGRCYQNLGEPDRAITNFRDYLRKGKDISPAEHTEIDGYIAEMEALKRQRAEASEAPPEGQHAAPVVPLPSGGNTATAAPVVIVEPAPAVAPQGEAQTPLYGRWWFWALIAGVVAAGVGVAAAAGAFTKTQDASCPAGFTCPQ